MPDPLDALSALGNNDALPLLQDELDKYHYSPELASLRYLIDSYNVNITLYDTQGRQIIKNIQKHFPAGKHQMNWDTENYPAGMYLISIQAGKQSTTEKIVIQ